VDESRAVLERLERIEAIAGSKRGVCVDAGRGPDPAASAEED
jgi:hypothetical protein